VTQVALSKSSLNSGDVFILDAGLAIFQWQGNLSGGQEKLKAAQVCHAITEERDGQPKVTVLDEEEDNDEFWEILGGKGPIATAEAGGDDLEYEKATAALKVLFRLSDSSGKMIFKEVGKGKVSRRLLDSGDVFVFDTGSHIFVWIGSSSSANERKTSMTYAQQYVQQHNRPAYLPITRILEGAENRMFETSFDD